MADQVATARLELLGRLALYAPARGGEERR